MPDERKDDNNKFLNITAGLFLAGFSVFVLKELSSILIPFVLAIIISFVFEPFFSWMKSKKIPQPLAIIIILIIIVILANIVSVSVIASINSFSDGFGVYEEKFRELVNSVIASLKLSTEEIESLNDSLKLKNLLREGSITSFIGNLLTSLAGIFGDFVLILFM